MITIIYGPMRSGKTFHKTAFASKFSCTHIVEDWLPQRPFRQKIPDDGALVLTTATFDQIDKAILKDDHANRRKFRILDITTARHLIGVAPHAPGVAERLAR
ncbi:hypothetical protein ACWGM0_17730 [Sphingomonas bisphenolicum]